MNARERTRPLDGAVNPNAETASQQGPVGDNEARRQERIAVAAYYKAERRGFRAGSEQDDWLEAEKEIDREGQRHDPAAPKDKSPRKPERRSRPR